MDDIFDFVESPDIDDLTTSTYALRSKELMDLTRRLRAIGTHADIDIPRIVVIGNQSSGKSSLVEAISGIQVPRDSGTCTRCPMECRISSSDEEWKCQVSLRFEYDGNSRSHNIREVPFGPPISLENKEQVESVLRGAQAALLNPHIPYEDVAGLLPGRLAELKKDRMLKFSRNVVCVDVSGPDLTTLAFLDLPGIIQNDETENVRLVEDLVVSSIAAENCLILVALPMNDDIENQKAVRLAQESDPTGKRTICVLTKPDCMPAGSQKRLFHWQEIIEGRSHPLKHGYYVTRQPDDDARANGITSKAARDAEEAFFRGDPWNKSTQRQRFGTRNLTRTLSRLLTDMTNDSLPTLRENVEKSLDECRKELVSIPRPIEDPATEVMQMVTAFSNRFNEWVDGSPGCESMVQTNRHTYKTFALAIKQTVPQFYPFRNEKDAQGRAFDPNATDEHDDYDNIKANTMSVQKSKTRYLLDMKEHITRCISWELPGNPPYRAKTLLVVEITSCWDSPAEQCLERVSTTVRSTLSEIINKSFDRFQILREQVRGLVFEDLRVRQSQGLAHLKKVLRVESKPIFTQNHRYYQTAREKWLVRYKEAKSAPLVRGEEISEGEYMSDDQQAYLYTGNSYYKQGQLPAKVPETPMEAALRHLSLAGYRLSESNLRAKLMATDEFEEELIVMADVRAYFQVAYRRISDSVPLAIEHQFIREVADGMSNNLLKNLRLSGPDAKAHCARLLDEDQGTVRKRIVLEAKLQRLEQAQMELLHFTAM
ncbi:hypothetical protein BOTBODRAFT_55684 [Botryobasidium botryosum FD-172 SS1]|uniref:GED domain-containing protein n=1 Tax=Botryobasidium botryosum (strain FD-172 SS1) TaxID=930990 RepID=A0A067MDW0_BOTB1|nr:hypothetical protein BOTBODRAFT_55684 [Botryobasidium botryosum FD-172 SS1]